MEKTLVLLKPDAIQRNLAGKIISRFEDSGLKIVGMKMVWADEKQALKHYPLDEGWAKNVFEKTKKAYDNEGKKIEYKDHIDFGKTIQNWLTTFLREGPIIAMVIEGPHAVELIRKMVGSTEPKQALPGTIRSDFASIESYSLADNKKRVLRNLIHASDSLENANKEIKVWFKDGEIHTYKKDLDRHF